MPPQNHILVFGANGAVGGAVISSAASRGWQVTAATRRPVDHLAAGVRQIIVNALAPEFSASQLSTSAPYSAVCWAQGANTNDSVYDFSVETHRRLYETNCTFILVTLQALLAGGLLVPGSRLVVISSIWQQLARQSKLSYCMTKAALHGLVLSAAADLAHDRHLINAVLPGALETPMTRHNLSPDQIDRLTQSTEHHRLATLEEVSSLVCFLSSHENTGITGQFISVDLGFSHVRIV